jgi:hypothetical protein
MNMPIDDHLDTAHTVPHRAIAQQSYDAYRAGKANWAAFIYELATIEAAIEKWRKKLDQISHPWLCWNVDDNWCLVQQRLVASVGWTPVVGFDPRIGPPTVISEGILIDFNKDLGFPAMNMIFPLEFVFLFAERLAFWHSDLLIRREKMSELAKIFASLADGQTSAVDLRPSLPRRLRGDRGRFWELVGCTTRAASADQFDKGSGWWRHIECHPNCPKKSAEAKTRKKYTYDHGAGILYWKKFYEGTVIPISNSYVDEGHCTGIGKSDYMRLSPRDARRNLGRELSLNYNLKHECKRLGLLDFLHFSK